MYKNRIGGGTERGERAIDRKAPVAKAPVAYMRRSRGEGQRSYRGAAHGTERSGASDLMERVCERRNLQAALKRVKKNKGSPGIDGMTVDELPDYLRQHWERLREELLAGTYQPQAVKRQQIPKSGGGVRELGIPTVLDQFIQQAVLQVLQPRFDPSFSQHSHGFRPGRRAHDAVVEAQRYIQEGRRWVVDNVYVRSRRAGERVMGLLRQLFAKLRLRINESKSAVDRAWNRKILGYSFWVATGRVVKRRVASKALAAMKERVRRITRRTRGRSVEQVVAELRSYLLGWKGYFGLADTPGVFAELDKWIRHRLRALHLKHWKRGKTIYRELRVRGLSEHGAARVAANGRRWWRNSGMLIHVAFPTRYFDELGLPRLAA
jgi:hypothetical protein